MASSLPLAHAYIAVAFFALMWLVGSILLLVKLDSAGGSAAAPQPKEQRTAVRDEPQNSLRGRGDYHHNDPWRNNVPNPSVDSFVRRDADHRLISTAAAGCTITADVRGNLGPPSAMLADADDNTDWLRHRWQAAGDLHGTALRGEHWVQLEWDDDDEGDGGGAVELQAMVLDWEAAYSYQYEIQILADGERDWETVLEAPRDIAHTTMTGHSPGVRDPSVPLHVVQTLREFGQAPYLPRTSALRIRMRPGASARGWGVSLWQVQVFGRRLSGQDAEQ